jgi:putative FmdB family regulatory protein
VGSRGESDDQPFGFSVPKIGHRSPPIGVVGERPALLSSNLLTPFNQPRAGPAIGNSVVQITHGSVLLIGGAKLTVVPIYEYEHLEKPGDSCKKRFEALQAVSEDALTACPECGEPVKRVVSKAQFKTKANIDPDHAGSKGFSTFKKAGDGVWEKTGGPGVDAIVGTEADKQAVREEKSKPSKVYDLDD